MNVAQLANLLAWIQSVPMDHDTLLEVKGAVFMAVAGFPAEATR